MPQACRRRDLQSRSGSLG